MVGYDSGFKKAVISCGWGCGYVAISEDHPYFKQNYDGNNDYFQIGGDQEVTYDKTREINGKKYWILGFDTAQSYNDKRHDFDYVFNEAMKWKQIVDAVK